MWVFVFRWTLVGEVLVCWEVDAPVMPRTVRHRPLVGWFHQHPLCLSRGDIVGRLFESEGSLGHAGLIQASFWHHTNTFPTPSTVFV